VIINYRSADVSKYVTNKQSPKPFHVPLSSCTKRN